MKDMDRMFQPSFHQSDGKKRKRRVSYISLFLHCPMVLTFLGGELGLNGLTSGSFESLFFVGPTGRSD